MKEKNSKNRKYMVYFTDGSYCEISADSRQEAQRKASKFAYYIDIEDIKLIGIEEDKKYNG